MGVLLVTADIHGSLSAWIKLSRQLKPGDCLSVAGDLFDTRYGDMASRDFKPDVIRKEFAGLSKSGVSTHYVYGNCDDEHYMEGYGHFTSFVFEGHSYFMSHGHLPLPDTTGTHVIIEGHSHVPFLDTLYGLVFLNPGSPVRPRRSPPSYARVEHGLIRIHDFMSDRVIAETRLPLL